LVQLPVLPEHSGPIESLAVTTSGGGLWAAAPIRISQVNGRAQHHDYERVKDYWPGRSAALQARLNNFDRVVVDFTNRRYGRFGWKPSRPGQVDFIQGIFAAEKWATGYESPAAGLTAYSSRKRSPT